MADSYNKPATAGGPPLTGLTTWYDAADVSTFTFSSGASVIQWADKSGNGFTLTASGAEPQRTGTQNGKASLVFNGTTTRMLTATVPSTAVDNLTIIVACKRTSGNATTSVVYQHGNPANSGVGLALRANNANIGLLRGGVGWTATVTPDPAAAGVLTLRRMSGTWSMHLNGVATNMTTTLAPNTPNTAAYMVSGSHFFGGEIYETLFYTVALSEPDRLSAESYLRTKWGTP